MNKKIPAIKTLNLKKYYYQGQMEVKALRGINLEVFKGETVAIIGSSGSGKTTLLNMLGALDYPTSGHVIIDGEDILEKTTEEITEIRRHKIGFIFQFYNLIPFMNVFENVEIPLLITNEPREKRYNRVKELLNQVGLWDKAERLPDELSGGQQQRVAIARALTNNPKIVLADEPTGDLDQKTSNMVIEQLINIAKKEGTCVLIVTHDLNIAEKLDRIYKIQNGEFAIDNDKKIMNA
ncbi:MAG: ABC transporter ATP-binding protein [Candidatus Ranarchaeia archaeon]